MDNLTHLNKLAKILNPDRIVVSEEVDQLLEALVAVLANNKKSVESISSETKEKLEEVLTYIISEHQRIITEVKEANDSTSKAISKQTEKELKRVLTEAKALMEEVRAIMPKDGKDADEERVISEVLARIQLPEYKEFILQGESIVDEINELPTDDDKYKIDAKHIKNLPRGNSGGGTSFAISRGQTLVHDLSAQLDGSTKTFNLPAFSHVFGISASSFPFSAFRKSIDYTTNASNMTITFTSEISADSTLAAGQTLLVQYVTP